MSGLQQYLRLFDEQRALIDGNSCAPLNAHRDDARRFLSGVDLPNRKTERYKYTNASAIFADEYHSDFTRTLDRLRPGDDRGCAVPNLATVPVHVINDVVVPLADDVELPEGVHLLSLCRAAAEHPEWLERYYDRAAHHEPANQHKHADREERDVVTRLNTLFAQDGLLIHVAAGVQMERTVQIVLRSRAAVDLLSHRRLLIVAEAGASVNVLVCEHADGTHRYLTTQVTEIYAAEDAAVSVYTLEETREGNHRFSNVYVEQQARSRVSLNGFSFTTGVSRTMTNVRLLGTGADCQTAGVAITDGCQHVDNNLLVDHVAEACTSDMLFKYVLDGESRAAFGGKVMVRPGAQQTLRTKTAPTSAFRPRRMCTRSRCSKSMPTTCVVTTVRQSANSTKAPCSICASAVFPSPRRACSCNMPLWPKCCSVCRVKRCAIGSPTSWNAVFAANSATVPTVVKNVPLSFEPETAHDDRLSRRFSHTEP